MAGEVDSMEAAFEKNAAIADAPIEPGADVRNDVADGDTQDAEGISARMPGDEPDEPIEEMRGVETAMPGSDSAAATVTDAPVVPDKPLTDSEADTELAGLLKDPEYVASVEGGADTIKAVFAKILPEVKKYGGWDKALEAVQAAERSVQERTQAAEEAKRQEQQKTANARFESHVDQVTEATARRTAASNLVAQGYKREDDPAGFDEAVSQTVAAIKTEMRDTVRAAEANKYTTRMNAARDFSTKFTHPVVGTTCNMDIVNEVASSLNVDPKMIEYYAAITHADTSSKIALIEQKYADDVRGYEEKVKSIPALIAQARKEGAAEAAASLSRSRESTALDASGERSARTRKPDVRGSMNDIDRMLAASGNA